MKLPYLFIGIFCLSLFSCNPTKEASKKTQKNETIMVSGTFRSIKGVKDPLSCYCYNAGYLETSEKTIAVCFDDENLSFDCEEVTLEGFYETEKIKPKKGDVCSAGTIQLLRVSEQAICNTENKDLKEEETAILGETETMKVAVGKDFEIKLKANATTGYQWFLEENYDKNVLTFVKKDYVADKTAQPMMGSGGKAIFSLKAKQKGTTNLKFLYKRFHEKTAVETKIYQIEVK